MSAICPGFIATNIYAASRYAGLSSDDGEQRGEWPRAAFERVAPGPDLVARRIQLAVRYDVPVLPVTVGAWLSYGTYHFATPVSRLAARIGGQSAFAGLERLVGRFLPGGPAAPKLSLPDETRTP